VSVLDDEQLGADDFLIVHETLYQVPEDCEHIR
jgi:hypothetical protein